MSNVGTLDAIELADLEINLHGIWMAPDLVDLAGMGENPTIEEVLAGFKDNGDSLCGLANAFEFVARGIPRVWEQHDLLFLDVLEQNGQKFILRCNFADNWHMEKVLLNRTVPASRSMVVVLRPVAQ